MFAARLGIFKNLAQVWQQLREYRHQSGLTTFARFVQDQAGHASPTTTAIYAKTNSKALKRQVEALDDL